MTKPNMNGPTTCVPYRCLLLLALAVSSRSEDWPQYRGANASGVSRSTGLPSEFGPAKNVLWKTALPPGHSSPILTEDRIFVTAFENQKLLTICLDRSTGKVLWRREAPRPRIESHQPTNTPASPSPVTDGRNVYVFFGDFGLLSYGPDGNERWREPLGPFNNVNGHGSSPILVGDKIVLICDQDTASFLIALDKESGRVVWKIPRPEATRGYCTPGVYRPPHGPVELIVPGSYQVESYRADTGEKLWWVRGVAWQVKTTPVIAGDKIYVNTYEQGGEGDPPEEIPAYDQVRAQFDLDKDGKLSSGEAPSAYVKKRWATLDLNKDGYLDEREWNFYRARRAAENVMVAIRAGGRGDLTGSNVLWRYRKSLPNTAMPLLYQDTIFLVKDGGVLQTLDPATGQLLKQGRLRGALDRYFASPVGADGKVYFTSEAGNVSVVSARGDWEILAVNNLDDECFATPAIADGRIYVRTRSALYCFGQQQGSSGN